MEHRTRSNGSSVMTETHELPLDRGRWWDGMTSLLFCFCVCRIWSHERLWPFTGYVVLHCSESRNDTWDLGKSLWHYLCFIVYLHSICGVIWFDLKLHSPPLQCHPVSPGLWALWGGSRVLWHSVIRRVVSQLPDHTLPVASMATSLTFPWWPSYCICVSLPIASTVTI